MKTRSEIIRSLIRALEASQHRGDFTKEIHDALYNIYDRAGHFEPDDLVLIIASATKVGELLPLAKPMFSAIAATAQDELMTRYRKLLRLSYKQNPDRAALVAKLGDERLADAIIREVENETDN
ncbi:MAG: hypothetical protein Q8L60_17535 [Gammaproteobacteria bacterium]|nr:hypothetical protein [Gammaproteobacteria bacterium]